MTAASVLLPLFIVTCSLRLVRGGIHCYQCSVLPGVSEQTEPSQLCAHFDGGPQYQVYCPYSTLCMKRTTRYKVRNETSTIVQRGCASQKYTLPTYNPNERRWQSKDQVDEDAYNEGCFVGENNGSPSGPSEFCYCQYHLCNGKSSIVNSIDLYGSIVLGIFIIELTCVQSILNNIF